MEFRVLGPIEFWATGKRRELGSMKERLILAILLLAEGRPVPVETLIDRVWGDEPPSEVRQSLHADIYRLRKLLKVKDDGGEACISGKSQAYTLETDLGNIDLIKSRRLREQAKSIEKSGDKPAKVELLRQADGLWLGEPLMGLSGRWAEDSRTALDSEYRDMALDLVDTELSLGHHSEIIPYLIGLVGRYESDEWFVERLMRAYYRCGRQTEALRLYDSTCDLLRTEYDTEPMFELRELRKRIRAHDPSLSFRKPPPSGRPAVINTLPPVTAAFAGRAEEVQTLARAAGPLCGVVAVEGMPGAGKTALALKVANEIAPRYPDAHLFLRLHAHDPGRPPETPLAALSTLLRGIGVEPGRIPQELAGRAEMWRNELRGRRALILLDDAADSEQITPLLPDNPDCHVIVTSRKSIDGIDGIRRFPLGLMPIEDAATLFIRIASPASPIPPDAVAEVVHLCDRLPLGVQLAATRLRNGQVSSIDALIQQMRDTHSDTAGLRDQALSAAFELSYRDLPLPQRRVFRSLGLSPVSELAAPVVAALADIPVGDAERCLRALVDHYLLEVITPGRYRLHDLLRQYARACAIREGAGERRSVGRALDHYRDDAHLADRTLNPNTTALNGTERPRRFADTQAAQEWMKAEWKNLFHLIQYAAHHGWDSHVIALAGAVSRYFDADGRWEEAEAVHRLAVKSALNLDEQRAAGHAYLNLATILWRTGQTREALGSAKKARDIAHRTGDQNGEAAALDRLGVISWSSSRYRPALAYSGEALDINRMLGNKHGEAACLIHIGIALAHMGRFMDALRKFRSALEIYYSLQDLRWQANALSNIADAQLQLGFHREAYQLLTQSQAIYDTIPGKRNHAILLINFGNVDRYKGRYDSALASYRKALEVFTVTGDRINESNVLNAIGTALCHLGRFNDALIHHTKALTVANKIGNISEQVRAYLGSGDGNIGLLQYAAAKENYRTGHQLALQISDFSLQAQALKGMAEVMRLTQGPDTARNFWRQAYDLFDQLGIVHEVEFIRLRLDDDLDS